MQNLYFPTEFKHSGPVLFIALASVICFAFHNSWVDIFEYNRALFFDGEYWRAITAHVFHTNFYHLLLNLGGLLLLWALHGEKYSLQSMTVIFLVTTVSIAVGIAFFTPDMARYVGLSGMLHGLFFWGACDDIRLGRKSGYGLVIGGAVKIASEQWQGPDEGLGGIINATVAIDAHLYGALSGVVAFAITTWLMRRQQA